MKALIIDRVKLVSTYDTYTLDELNELLSSKTAELTPEQRETVTFTIDVESFPYDDNEYPGLFMMYKRLETDEEEATRKAREAAYVQQQAARDRAEFERLSKLFNK